MERRVVALAGGVGGAKLAHGLQLALADPSRLTVIVNIADDFDLYGLRICPDLDTVLYTLAGLANPATGWGVRDDSFQALEMIGRYLGEPWFRLGDRDLATHIVRSDRLRRHEPLSAITADLARALGIAAQLVPASDEPIATMIDTAGGSLDFQDYFVARRHQDVVSGVRFEGIERARPSEAAVQALASADAVILCPSNPIVSIAPILAIAGMRALVAGAPGPRVAVSPIVGGEALKGPAAAMLASLGHEVSALGVARIYAGLLDGFVLDALDAALAPAIEELGMRVLVTDTIMRDDAARERLARETLDFACSL